MDWDGGEAALKRFNPFSKHQSRLFQGDLESWTKMQLSPSKPWFTGNCLACWCRVSGQLTRLYCSNRCLNYSFASYREWRTAHFCFIRGPHLVYISIYVSHIPLNSFSAKYGSVIDPQRAGIQTLLPVCFNSGTVIGLMRNPTFSSTFSTAVQVRLRHQAERKELYLSALSALHAQPHATWPRWPLWCDKLYEIAH